VMATSTSSSPVVQRLYTALLICGTIVRNIPA
jgi:hypothetical protein